MEQWLVFLLCGIIAFVSVLVAEAIKYIWKDIFKKKGKKINMKKAEYPLSAIPIILTFAGVFCFLYFGKFGNLKNESILKICGIFASSTQTIYTFFVQTIRKGGYGIITAIKNLQIKTSKPNADFVENVGNIIKDIEPQKKVQSDEDKIAEFLKTIGN